MCSLPLAGALESQLTAEKSLRGRHWNSPKKIPHIQRQRRSHNQTVEGHNHNKINSHNCWVGDSQTGEHLYHRSPPTGVKVLTPHQASKPGGLATGGGIPRESDFEGWRDLIARLQQDWGKQRVHSWRAHTK